MIEAKFREISEFLGEGVARSVRAHAKVPEDRLMSMRWILTW